jgi:uncharacterized protein (UPF0276 family)
LFRTAHGLTGGVSTLLEWDARIPEFPIVHQEILKAKQILATSLTQRLHEDVAQASLFNEHETVPHPALVMTSQAD